MPVHASSRIAEPERSPGGQVELHLGALLRRAAAMRPDAPAIAEAADTAGWYHREPDALSLGALGRRADTLGAAMLALGLGPGDRVIVQLPNVADLGSTILGLASAGLVPCPLPPSFGPDTLGQATDTVGAFAIITTARFGRQNCA
jgi:acyl-CoA synthetase (AMP-forming)/AMP-acid ligase II